MSVNRKRPHLIVIPEDEANRQLMTGFMGHLDVNSHQVQIENVARGWSHALDRFETDHIEPARRFQDRHILLLIDFDGRGESRLQVAREKIPDDLIDRVFVLGVASEPEALRAATGNSFEQIGEGLAEGCVGRSEENLWTHELLRHNEAELTRMEAEICQFLRA